MSDQNFRYRKLGYAALNVTNLERSLAFYRDVFGLDVSDIVPLHTAFLRCSRDHHNLVLQQAPVPGLKRIGFEMETEEDLEKAGNRLAQLGMSYTEVDAKEMQALKEGKALRFRLPHCHAMVELYVGMKQLESDFTSRIANIVRLGHVVLATPFVEETTDWLTKEFGFRSSDRIDDRFFAFLRCHPNPYHHSLALCHAAENRLHHVAFMVGEVDDIGRAIHRFSREKVKVVFGPGRHVASGSIFYYFLDPDGITVEYTHGMEEFSETTPRPARLLPRSPLTADQWGSLPSDQYGKIGALE